MYDIFIKTMRMHLILLIICMVSICSYAGTADEEPVVEEAQALSPLDEKLQKTVSIDVSDVPIDVVIRQLADQVDVDFIKSPNVTGEVTVTLTEVTVEEALQSILDVHGCAYIKGDNVIRILPRAEMPEISERLVTETFEIIYADVTQVVRALQDFKSAQGSVSSIQGTSHIIVTDTENKIRDIAKLLEKIDKITPQVLVEVRIYDITSQDFLDLGIDWYAGSRTNYNSSGLASDSDITVSRNGSSTYINSNTEPSIGTLFTGDTSMTSAGTQGLFQVGMLNESIDITAVLRAEKENVDAKLLANPRLMVLDNESALFDIITEYPYTEKSTSSSGNDTYSVKFKEVGIKMAVTPHVTPDGMVRMHIQPEFGVVTGEAQVASSDVPIVDKRKVDTNLLVRDNQSVVIGGMRKKGTSMQVNKVPLLGDIPIIGRLFRFEGESTIVTELVVFITPRIIIEPSLTEYEKMALEITHFNPPEPKTTKAEEAGFGLN